MTNETHSIIISFYQFYRHVGFVILIGEYKKLVSKSINKMRHQRNDLLGRIEVI